MIERWMKASTEDERLLVFLQLFFLFWTAFGFFYFFINILRHFGFWGIGFLNFGSFNVWCFGFFRCSCRLAGRQENTEDEH